MSDWSDHDNDDLDFVSAGDDDDGEQRLSSMFHLAKSKGVSEDSYADWQAIVAKECESCDGRNFSFKASKRIFRIELTRGDFATAQATFERLVSFIPVADVKAVHKAFLNRKSEKNLLDVVCPKLDLVPCLRNRSAIEKTDAEIQFILSIHRTLLDAVKTMRGALLHVFKACSLRQAKLLCCLGDVDAAVSILVSPTGLLSLLRDESGNDLHTNANQLIELYALLAPIHCDRQEWRNLESVIERVRSIEKANTGLVDIMNIAVFRECEGMLCSQNKLWNEAFDRFHESYTLFCQSNHARRFQLLVNCVIVCCLTDQQYLKQMAVAMEAAPEVKAIMLVNDTVKSVVELSECFRAGTVRALKAAQRLQAALRGEEHHIITSQSFFSGVVDSVITLMYSKLRHSVDPYFEHLICRLVYARREGEDKCACIAANCRFIHQAESFSHKCASLIMQKSPANPPSTMFLQRCSKLSHTSVPRHVRCGLDSFIACSLASSGDPQKKRSNHLTWAHSIIAHLHRRRCRRMLETLVDMKEVVVLNGYAYKSLAGHDPHCRQARNECGNMYAVRSPWQLCPLTSDARQVCAGYPWASYALVLADGSSYYTKIGPSLNLYAGIDVKKAERVFMPGREASGSRTGSLESTSSNCLKEEGGKYTVDADHLCRWTSNDSKYPLKHLPQANRCFDILLRRRLTDDEKSAYEIIEKMRS